MGFKISRDSAHVASDGDEWGGGGRGYVSDSKCTRGAFFKSLLVVILVIDGGLGFELWTRSIFFCFD